MIAVEDTGRGMDAERLREITRNLFNSSKAADPKTIGEKAIGILAFQQLGGRCDIVTRPVGSAETLALRLVRGSPRAGLTERAAPGAQRSRNDRLCLRSRPRRPTGSHAPQGCGLPAPPPRSRLGSGDYGLEVEDERPEG